MTIRPLQLVFTLYQIAVFLAPLAIPAKSPQSIIPITTAWSKLTLPLRASRSAVPAISHYSVDQIIAGLDSSRTKLGLTPLINDPAICQTGENLFPLSTVSGQLTADSLVNFCPTCTKKAFLAIEGNYFIQGENPWMQADEVTKLTSQGFTHLCLYQSKDQVLLLLGTIPPKTPAGKIKDQINSPSPVSDFSEGELWQALIDYRHAHQKPDLQTVDSLCQYARERVAEHIKLYSEKPQSQYQNQAKYPLDAHAGFERDGESGYLFEKTGFNVVAENLAYWPSASSPNQVIEWGWDTSTEGHREAQLSTEYSHACISGSQGFYVAIFARN